ncbi:MAG: glycosyltransferase [bacterium]|nr:glycosyltransferase [bacterium]
MSSPGVAIVILTWNGLEFTKRCLHTIRTNTLSQGFEIIVVDNGSSDGTVEYLRAQEDIRVITNRENVGFARANNQAIAVVPGKDVVLLNNDTEIPPQQGDWLEKLRAAAYSADDIGIVGCRLRRPNGMLQHAGAYMPVETFWGQQIGSEEKDINQYPFLREVESVVFACVYIKRAVIDKIGPLPEEYFAYFEDTDYCLAARRAGFRVMCCGEVTIIHHENVSTRENRVRHADLFKRSQQLFKQRWGDYLQQRYEFSVAWRSTVSRPHGYGMTCKDLLLELDRQNVEIAYRYLYGQGTVFPVEEPENTGIYLVNIMKNRPLRRQCPQVVYGQGDAFHANDGSYKIGYTMLEVSGLPATWVKQANMMDEVWVPTEFNRETFAMSGVKRPMHVMPLGVDINYFNPQIVRYPVCDEYKFLTVFEWGERKAPELLIKTFNETFRADEPVVLLCKANVTDPGIDVRAILRSLNLSANGGRIEFIFNKYFPHHQLGALYRSADCFVLPSRGEGWGMPILEAMACGLPVIATYWSAPTAFMNDSNSYPLQVRALVPAVAKCPYYAGFKWAEPDVDHLRYLLRYVYEHQDEARQKGQQAAADVAARWTVWHAAERIKARLAEVSMEVRTARRPVVSKPKLPHRVGIDVSRAIGEQITGVGRYTLNVVRGLAEYANEDVDFVLLPGFGTFVHPEYGRRFHFEVPRCARMTLYRGVLPAFASAETAAHGLDLVHSTAYMVPPHLPRQLIVTVHDLTFITHAEHHTKENVEFCTKNLRRAIECGAHFIAVSAHTRDELIRVAGVEAERISVVYNTYDARRFNTRAQEDVARVRRRYNLPERYMLFLASMEPRKNLATVLAAVRTRSLGCPLVVAGARGWFHGDLDATLRMLSDRVIMLGYVNDEDLPGLYAGARVLVYPSLSEGFGLPVVEALACGTPVITSAVSSLPEVTGGGGILLKNPRDADALAEAMERITEDDELRSHLVGEGLSHVARFRLERVTGELLNIYRMMLERNG